MMMNLIPKIGFYPGILIYLVERTKLIFLDQNMFIISEVDMLNLSELLMLWRH